MTIKSVRIYFYPDDKEVERHFLKPTGDLPSGLTCD